MTKIYNYYTWFKLDFNSMPAALKARWNINRSAFTCNINYQTLGRDGKPHWYQKENIAFDDQGRSESVSVKSNHPTWEKAKVNEIDAAWNIKVDGCEIWNIGDVTQMFRGEFKNQYDIAKLDNKRVAVGCTKPVQSQSNGTANQITQHILDEMKITVIIELPHSKETGVGAKGLAGHTAMAIEERYFDYGPDYSNKKTFNEKQYEADSLLSHLIKQKKARLNPSLLQCNYR